MTQIFESRFVDREARCQEITTFNKIRLCAVVLNAEVFPKHLEFMPDAKNVEPGCVRKTVKFLYGYSQYFRDRNVSDVWMVTCRAKFILNPEPKNIYLVPGNYTDEYYICEDAEGINETSLRGFKFHERMKPDLKLQQLPFMI